jgi:membrane-associated protein
MIEAANIALGGGALDPQHLIQTLGLIGLLAIIFAECGLLVGFFLPGDTLLFAAGLYVSTGRLDQPLAVVIALAALAAIAGNLMGYGIGYKAGPAIFRRPDSRLFREEYVVKAGELFERFGPLAIILARFVPVVRTFITVMAGAAKMNFRRFALYSVIGGIFWTASMIGLGYWLGNVEIIANNLDLIVITAVAVSVLPVAFEVIRRGRKAPTA